MKYIFLDIDGPLNTGRNDYLDPERYGHHFDEMAVKNLRRIIDETGAKIVFSSSWRHMGLVRIREIWKEWRLPGDVVGCTPGEWGSDRVFNSRGEEIQQWLIENAVDDCTYVILDDMDANEAIEEQKDNWITVNTHTGISLDDAERAIALLNKANINIRKLVKEEKKLLFPVYPLMHVGWRDDWKDYMLSGVLATHGYTIRRIMYESSGQMEVHCCRNIEDNQGRDILFISPMVDGHVSCPYLHWNDLRIRYHVINGELTNPVWTQAYAYGNGQKECWLAAVLDLIGMSYSQF